MRSETHSYPSERTSTPFYPRVLSFAIYSSIRCIGTRSLSAKQMRFHLGPSLVERLSRDAMSVVEHSYKPEEVMRAELNLPESFTSHPLFTWTLIHF
jgi:hypothetical protein